MAIFEKVTKITKEKGMSLCEVEQKAKLGRGCISKWKKITPNLASLNAVALVLGVPITELLEEDN